MKPIELSPDTTVLSFVREILPREHRARVTSSDAKTHVVVARIDGLGSFTLRVTGAELTIEDGEVDDPSFWVASDKASAERMLEDALGPGELMPDVPDASKVPAATDPKLLAALAMVQGSVRASLSGFGPRDPWVAFGAGNKRKKLDPDAVDCEVVVPFSVAKQVVALSRKPDEALRDVGVEISGNKFVAMQAALALAQMIPR